MTVIDRLFTANRALKSPGSSWLCQGCRNLKAGQCIHPDAECFESGVTGAGVAVCSRYKKRRGKSRVDDTFST